MTKERAQFHAQALLAIVQRYVSTQWIADENLRAVLAQSTTYLQRECEEKPTQLSLEGESDAPH